MSQDVYEDVYDFDGYSAWIIKTTKKAFLDKLSAFGQTFLEYVSRGLVANTDEYMSGFAMSLDLSAVIQEKGTFKTHLCTVALGRFVLMTCRGLKKSIEKTLASDFPKFLGSRSNFWRYLIHFIQENIRIVDPDFTTQFLVTNACFVALMHYCLKLHHFYITKHDKRLWICMVLYFFGDRFKEETDATTILDLKIPALPNEEVVIATTNRKKKKK